MGEITQEYKDALGAMQQKALEAIEALRTEWKGHYDELKAQGAPVKEITEKVERALKRLDSVEQEMTRPGGIYNPTQTKSLGELVATNEAVQDLAKQMKGAGFVRGRAASMPVKSFMQFPDFIPGNFYNDFSLKTTITSSAVGSSTPGILVPERMPGIVMPGIRRMRVRDLLPRMTTQNNAVEFVKENAFTNMASPTAETVSKGESGITFTIDSETVKTLAHWLPAAKQVLDDFQALQGYINQRLLIGLKDIEDYELVGGDGTGQHLSGLINEATAYDTSRNVSGDTRIDKLSHAISQIEDALFEADGIILNPRDWRTIQLIKDETGGPNTGRYILGGPAGLAQQVLWGVAVATSHAVAPGEFLVGSFARYCAVWDRMEATVDISTEHADYFIRNMVAIRAEERLTLTVTRSDAVVHGSF